MEGNTQPVEQRRPPVPAAFSLVRAMGPDEDLAKPVMDPVEVTVCEDCAMVSTSIAVLAGRGQEQEG